MEAGKAQSAVRAGLSYSTRLEERLAVVHVRVMLVVQVSDQVQYPIRVEQLVEQAQ